MNKDYVEKKLSNGIKVYFLKDDNMKRVHVSYNVNYGTHGYFDKFYYKDKSYHVEPAIAHFLEHMLIETSKRGNMLLNYMDRNYDANGTLKALRMGEKRTRRYRRADVEAFIKAMSEPETK